MDGCLGRTPPRRTCRVGIEAVFDDVMINGRKLDGGELADALINDMKFVVVIGGSNIGFKAGELTQNPAIEPSEFLLGYAVFCRVEIVEVRKLVAQGVANYAVGFR